MIADQLNFFLFANDTNPLYADKHLCSLEATVNKELASVCNWPMAMTAARLAQLGERRSAEQEAVGSNPGRTNTQGL